VKEARAHSFLHLASSRRVFANRRPWRNVAEVWRFVSLNPCGTELFRFASKYVSPPRQLLYAFNFQRFGNQPLGGAF